MHRATLMGVIDCEQYAKNFGGCLHFIMCLCLALQTLTEGFMKERNFILASRNEKKTDIG